MLHRIRDAVIETREHRALTRGINRAIADGDQEAEASFTSGTGTLRAALTREGRETRGAEITAYAERVVKADGNGRRVHRLGRRD
ncbi:hypothetical protein [Streptomyces javensis]|uniref:hypothetical protein n=1 Tax=Streptomyces javensis TaxID=114698 RepID=UPI001FE79573|nr:hypothetical protein [Streptomyces javensis]